MTVTAVRLDQSAPMMGALESANTKSYGKHSLMAKHLEQRARVQQALDPAD